MKWLIGLVLLAQAPFLFIGFVAAGTDGKMSSLLKGWAVVIPIALCGLYASTGCSSLHGQPGWTG